ncbi:hypothetical protein BDF22DRAFT_652976 [Syncephalis plumigaleata]|nr:hypothetical protein BDF22DRAFT_652976 [Syncephalis plumigaleata]
MSFLEAYQSLIILVTLLAYLMLSAIAALAVHFTWKQPPLVLRLRSTPLSLISVVMGMLLVAAQLTREYAPDSYPCTIIYWAYLFFAPGWLLGVTISVVRMCWLVREEALTSEANKAISNMRLNTGKQFLDWMHKWDAPELDASLIDLESDILGPLIDESFPQPPSPQTPLPEAPPSPLPMPPSPTTPPPPLHSTQSHQRRGTALSITIPTQRDLQRTRTQMSRPSPLLTGNTMVSQGPSRSILSRMVDTRQLWLDTDAPESASRVTADHLINADWSYQRQHWFKQGYLIRGWLYAALAHLCPAFALQIITKRYSIFPVAYGNCVGGMELSPSFIFCVIYLIMSIIFVWRLTYGNSDTGSGVSAAAVRTHMPKFIHWEISLVSLSIAVPIGGFIIGYLWSDPPFSPDLFLTVAVIAVHTTHVVIPNLYAITTRSQSAGVDSMPRRNRAETRASLATIAI